jgi:error-prone DNA polymerase
VQVAIIRPGPIVAGAFHPYMEFRKMIAAGKPVDIDYGHPELAPLRKDVLGETVGHVLYQDQVLQISCAVAGFTPGQADKLRRAMSRKRSSEAMQALAEEFYEGAAAQGVSREAAEVAFNKMAAFAAFGFPKSHAVAFALLAYESTWLRYHYPTAYYCALFNAQPMGFYSVEVLTGDVNRHGIQVLAPSINISKAMAWPEMGDIRLGIEHVKGIGGGWRERAMGRKERKLGISNLQFPTSDSVLSVAERTVFEREKRGAYRSLYDLVTRARLSREQAEALIEAGALDEFGLERREMLWQLGLMVDSRFTIRDFQVKKVGEVSPQCSVFSAGEERTENSALSTPDPWAKEKAKRRRKRANAYQAPLPLPTAQDMAELPSLSEWEELAWDFARIGTTGKKHPMALVRPLLHEGMITTRHLGGPLNPNRLEQGATVEIAGMIVTRQRPATASGVMFMLLEDEFGLANIVVYTPLQERQRELVRATPFVIIRGKVDNVKSGFPNIIAERYRPCPLPGRIEAPDAHNFG